MVYWFDMVPVHCIFQPEHLEPDCGCHHHGGFLLHIRQCRHEVIRLLFRGLPGDLERGGTVFLSFSTRVDIAWPSTIIVGLVILTFIPIKFVHPLRVAHWRNITIPMTVLWAAMTLEPDDQQQGQGLSDRVYKDAAWVCLATSLYFAGISLWRTFVQGDPGHGGRTRTDHAT